jgi:cysteine synthase
MNNLPIFGAGTRTGGTVGGTGVSVAGVQPNVPIIWVNTADSASLLKTGGGVEEAPGSIEWRTKSILMQALFLRVE